VAILAVDEVWLREPRLLVPRLQPVGNIRVDTAHPIARNMIHAQVFSRGIRPIAPMRSRGETLNGDAKVVGGKLMLDGTGDYLMHDTLSQQDLYDQVSMLCVGSIAQTKNQCLASLMIAVTDGWFGWYFHISSSNVWSANTARNSVFDGSITLTGALPGTNVIAMSSVGNTKLQAALNGQLGTADTSYTNPQSGVDTFRLAVGAIAKMTPDNFLNGACEAIFVWNRGLTDAELVSVTLDPYQFLIPA
jgi:hypothetical protein